MCATCLEQHVRMSCDLSDPAAQQRLLTRDGAAIIACPFADVRRQEVVSCEESLRLSQLAVALPAAVLDDVVVPAMKWVATCSGEGAAADKIAKESSAKDMEKQASTYAAQIMLRAALPDAYQCGRCGHGPVLHMACSDLRSHHGERVGGVTRSNACGKCGWFADNISAWPRWDGKLRDENNIGMQVTEMGPGFVLVMSRSLWRNSFKIEALINYGIGACFSLLLSPRVFKSVWWLLTWLWLLLNPILRASWWLAGYIGCWSWWMVASIANFSGCLACRICLSSLWVLAPIGNAMWCCIFWVSSMLARAFVVCSLAVFRALWQSLVHRPISCLMIIALLGASLGVSTRTRKSAKRSKTNRRRKVL